MENKIKEGIPLIKEWIQIKKHEFEDNTDFKELIRVIKEIETDQDFSNDAYEDIRFLLRPFEYIPLKIKRLFNIGTLDNYTIFIASRHFNTIDDYINLELCTSRFNGNMTKFHYNPISMTQTTRKFFPNIQTLYLYSSYDRQFEKEKRFIARKYFKNKRFDLFQNQINQLEKWTGLRCGDIIFDSNVDNWSSRTSVFYERIREKKQLVFIIEDTDGEIFGYYSHTNIIGKYYNWEIKPTDNKTFEFNLQSNKFSLNEPVKFK